MADGTTFSIDIGVQAAGVDSASDSLNTLTDRLVGAGDASTDVSRSLTDEASSLDRLASAAAGAADEESQLARQADEVAEATEGMGEAAGGSSTNFRMLGAAFGKLGGPLGQVGQQASGFASGLQKMSKSIGAFGPYVAAAVIAVALAAAIGVATLAIAKFAITSADTARTSALLSAGIARSVEGGAQLDKTIEGLGNTVPLTREELTSMASDLANTGLRGDALSASLETAAVKAAKLKYGPDFAKQMLSLDSQSRKLKANVTGIFSGLKIEGLLEGLSKLVALFDSTSATGKAMKVVFESLFQPIVDGITAMIPKVVSGFIQFEILLLKAAIAVKPFTSKIEMLGVAILVIAAIVVGTFLVALALAVAPIVIAIAFTTLLVAGLIWLGQAIAGLATQAIAFGASLYAGVVSAFDSVTAKIHEVIDYLTNTSLLQIGTDMVMGLVNGITGAGGAIFKAMTGAVSGAIDGAKKLLGIASPSKVFAEIGMNTAEGMAGGVDDHAGKVQGSLEDMVSPPDAKGGASPSAKGGAGMSLSGNTFIFQGVEGMEDAEARFAGLLTRILEGDVAQLGTAVPV